MAALQVVQALAVSLNKLGDREYLGKDLRGAMQHYKEALRIRQESCKGAEPVPAEALLGLVTSLLKVVDIEQVSLRHLCVHVRGLSAAYGRSHIGGSSRIRGVPTLLVR